MHVVTRILSAIEQVDSQAAEQLPLLVYEELRRPAAGKIAQGTPRQTLRAMVLVHQACVRPADAEKAQHRSSPGHFFSPAAEPMRRILAKVTRGKAQEISQATANTKG